jgi:nitric oxide reductase NorE protein
VPAFAVGQATLNQNYGAINTLLLLVSSWFVVLAVADVREREGSLAPRLFVAALACGIAFVVVKAFEYAEKFGAGITISTSDFFMY